MITGREPGVLTAHHPSLFHMAHAGPWPTIQRLGGPRSVISLLDLFSAHRTAPPAVGI